MHDQMSGYKRLRRDHQVIFRRYADVLPDLLSIIKLFDQIIIGLFHFTMSIHFFLGGSCQIGGAM